MQRLVEFASSCASEAKAAPVRLRQAHGALLTAAKASVPGSQEEEKLLLA